MWQISWMINLLPDWIWTALTVGGLIALAASILSTPWKIPLKIGGLIAVLLGSWCMGIAANEAKWQSKVKKLEHDLEIARTATAAENVRIEEKILYRDRVIKEKGKDIIQYVDNVLVKKEEVIKFIENCPLPKDIVDQHNAAATLNRVIEDSKEAAKK